MGFRQVTIHGVMVWEDPGIWGGGNVPMPTPPIYYPPSIWPNPPGGGNPPGIWGGGNVPMPTPPIAFPPSIWPNPPGGGHPPGIWGGGNVPMPTPPINLPGQPPGIWGGGNVPMPTPPIYMPPPGYHPSNPIVLPPPYPAHPIIIPPEAELGPGDKFLVYYNPKYGWVVIPVGGSEEGGGGVTPAPKPEPKR